MAYDNIFKLFPNERYMDITLYQYGMEQCSASYSYGPATRNHYLFHYILSGKGTLQSTDTNGKTHLYHLSAGSGFLIYPGQINTYTADNDHPWSYCWLEFDGMKAKDIVASTGITADMPVYHATSNTLRDEMKKEMLSIIQNDGQTSLYLIGHLYQFLDLFVRSSFNHTKLQGNLKDLYIKEATTFVEHNYRHPDITIKDMATFCSLNQNYLAKIFKEVMKQTPQQFLIYYRMNKAAELLKHTMLPVGEISKQVGYPNQLNFSRTFKNTFGKSPQNWRKENRMI